MDKKNNRYSHLIENIFKKYYTNGATTVNFERTDFEDMAIELGIKIPKNLGDILYSFRYRADLPKYIVDLAPEGLQWVIMAAGRSKYQFKLVKEVNFIPSEHLAKTKIPDSTPGIIMKYAFDDEQGLLAKVRYNRLIDIFTGLTCYSLQNHLRTTVEGIGQIETDEIYIGIDKQGSHYIIPVQAKGGTDKIGIVQIEQDFAVCKKKFPSLYCIPIAAQFMNDGSIALFEFTESEGEVKIATERHYKLVNPGDLSPEELESYRRQSHA